MPQRRSLSVVSLVFLLCVGTDPLIAKELKFRGRQMVDKKVGLIVVPQKPIGVAVSSTLHHFWVLLPYSETWTFESTESQPLKAVDDRHAVTVAAYPATPGGTAEYLEGVLKSLQDSDAVVIRKAEFVVERNRRILRYEAAPSSRGPWLWNYWTAVEHSGRGVSLHLSVLHANFEPSSGERGLRVLLSSLEADFGVRWGRRLIAARSGRT
jgi:hypothetical protein